MNTVSIEEHNALVQAAYEARGFSSDEAKDAADMCVAATWHGNRTHNALKALHLDDLFGSKNGGCTPGAEIEVVENRFSAAEVWNSNKKLGQSVAKRAFDRAIELADQHGIGMVSVITASTTSGVAATSLRPPSAATSHTQTAPLLSLRSSLLVEKLPPWVLTLTAGASPPPRYLATLFVSTGLHPPVPWAVFNSSNVRARNSHHSPP